MRTPIDTWIYAIYWATRDYISQSRRIKAMRYYLTNSHKPSPDNYWPKFPTALQAKVLYRSWLISCTRRTKIISDKIRQQKELSK